MNLVDPRNKRFALITVTILAALAAVACGGDDSGSSNAPGFWPAAYNPSGLPEFPSVEKQYAAHPSDIHPGACLSGNCHGPDGSALLKLAWGGIAYKADGSRAGNVEVGVVSGSYKEFVYTSTDGYYWKEGDPSDVNWGPSDIRARNAKGEKVKKQSDERNGDCDSCHQESGGSAKPLTLL
ncbi:MAG TPA: hypothetical protein VKP30_11615 [Polyangiaceae bacterium]|nr:hypothetical protein [Polyangiaceae bacterium]